MEFNDIVMDIVYYKPDRAELIKYLSLKNKIILLGRFIRGGICSEKILHVCNSYPDFNDGYKLALCHGAKYRHQDEEFITMDWNCMTNPDLFVDLDTRRETCSLDQINIPSESCQTIISFNSPHEIINGNFIRYFLSRLKKGGMFYFIGFKKPSSNNSKTLRLITLINQLLALLRKFNVQTKVKFRYEILQYGTYRSARPELCIQLV